MFCAMLALLWACDKEDSDTLPGRGEALHINATKLGFLEQDGKTRVTTDENTMQTTFQTGDAIGIFAIKDGVVQADCKNLKMTLQGDGSWGGNTVYFVNDATYFAYSPYRDEVSTATSIAQVVQKFTLSNDQSDISKFTANDLMTSTSCTADKASKSLTITFEHAFTMLETEYAYCKGKGELYQLNSLVACELHLVDESSAVVSGYHPSSSSALMRFLLKPGTARKVAALYERTDEGVSDGAKYPSYYTEGTMFNLTKNKRYKLKPYKNRDVKPGDYYYSDGTIYLKEWMDAGALPPDINHGCVGVVCNTTMEAADQGRQWKNGYVLATRMPGMTWGIGDFGNMQWNIPNINNWGPKVVLIGNAYCKDWNALTALTSSGYNECQNILALNNPSQFTAVYGAVAFANEAPLPTGQTSGWYLPDINFFRKSMRILGEKPNAFSSDHDWDGGGAAAIEKATSYLLKVGATKPWMGSVDGSGTVFSVTEWGVDSVWAFRFVCWPDGAYVPTFEAGNKDRTFDSTCWYVFMF